MVHVWDATTGVTSFIYRGHAAGVIAIAWSPDGTRIASASLDKTVQVWDIETGQKISSFEGHAGMVYAVAWSPDGKRIASASKDNIVQVWDAEHSPVITRSQPQANVLTFRTHSDSVYAVVWLPDGKHIASASGDGSVQVWQAVYI